MWMTFWGHVDRQSFDGDGYDGTGIIDDMNVSVGRVKLGFEGERVIVMEDGNRFAVFGQVGGRHDSGDGDTGSGGGGIGTVVRAKTTGLPV